MLFEEFSDARQCTSQPVFVQRPAEIFIDHTCAECGGVEEVEGLAVAQDLLERFGHGGQIDRGPVAGGVVEHILLGEDRLARARIAANQHDSVQGQTAAEDGVQSVGAAR
jgi:hypothetical protein